MQAERLQRLQKDLLAVLKELDPLQKQHREELRKDKSNDTKLDQLKEAIVPLAAEQQQLLDEQKMLESQPGVEQWLMQGGRQPT